MSVKFSKVGNWRACWGDSPLPDLSIALGLVQTDTEIGALILVGKDYFIGVGGQLNEVDQLDVKAAVARSRAAANLGRTGGSARTPAK